MKRSHSLGYRRFLAQVMLCFWAVVGFAQDDSYRFTTLTNSADTWYATAVYSRPYPRYLSTSEASCPSWKKYSSTTPLRSPSQG